MHPYIGAMVTREFNIKIICKWDGEAKVWVAESEDLPGLVTEAATIPELIQRSMEVIPELIESNLMGGEATGDYQINLAPVYQQTVRIAAH
ncbi:MAG: DUF1902 domain-containing protein [Alphaproteobacteria bacterium]|nr:DUF1902 domain-containing protein [Alphaproteobacteria bacterium]